MAPMALLIMDVQQGIVERFASDAGYLDRLATAIAAARGAGVAVTYVTLAFRPGYPEVSERNKTFSAIAGTGRFTDGDPGMRIPAVIAPGPGEVTVTKRRVSAFAGSDLEVLLRARAIHHLVLAGIATSGVMLSTLRQAADLDY
jgi:nicotinamidase-related amidase